MPARNSKGQFVSRKKSMARSGRTTALARRSPGVVVVRQTSSPAKKKGGGKKRRGGGGGSAVTSNKKKAWIFGGGAAYGRLRAYAKKDPNGTAARAVNAIPVVKEIGMKGTHGVILAWLAPKAPAGWIRELVDGAACALIGATGIAFGEQEFDLQKTAALGEAEVMSASQVRERFNLEGE